MYICKIIKTGLLLIGTIIDFDHYNFFFFKVHTTIVYYLIRN